MICGVDFLNVVSRFWAVLIIAVRRLLTQRWIALVTLCGLILTVSISVSIPLYADAVYYRVLLKELSTRYEWQETPSVFRPGATPIIPARIRPPFAFIFRYTGQIYGAVEWEAVELLDQYLSTQAGNMLGLPQQMLVRYMRTADYRLFLPGETIKSTTQPFALSGLGFISDFNQHVELLAGAFPDGQVKADGSVDVLISAAMAKEKFLKPGDLLVTIPNSTPQVETSPITLHISGVWEARNPKEDFWFYDPSALDSVMLVPEGIFRSQISPQVNREVYTGLWYLVMDGEKVHAGDVKKLLNRITVIQRWESYYLPNADLDLAIVQALEMYRTKAGQLTIQLYAFSVPILGLLLAFIGMMGALAIEQRQNEIAILRSRGGTTAQVVGITVVECSITGILALAAGAPLAMLNVGWMDHSRNLQDISYQSDLRLDLPPVAMWFGLATIVVGIIAQLIPALNASKHTIISYKSEKTREIRPAWWRRYALDLILFIPAAYGTYLLRQQGSIILPGTTAESIGDPFQNPLLFLVPALGIFSVTLFVLRILPRVMTLVAWGSTHQNAVGLLLAARHLARTSGNYATPFLLLVWTLSLSVFTASLADVLDRHLIDQTYYREGADMVLVESGQIAGSMTETLGSNNPAGSTEVTDGERWWFLPVIEHLNVPGVEAAARVGRYPAVTHLADKIQAGAFLGIDRVDFTKVAFWRSDFGPKSLGALMNALGETPEGILLSRSYMQKYGIQLGDRITINIKTYSRNNELTLIVVGSFDLFPSWYPTQVVQDNANQPIEQENPLFVGNLDYLFENAGGEYPYHVWLNIEPGTDFEQVAAKVLSMNIRLEEWRAPELGILQEQQRPERQGVFGVLSIGFLASTLFTILGFLFYIFFSFRRRFVEIGILRAIGLSIDQTVMLMFWEITFLIVVGAAVGTGLGVGMSKLFIPYLQAGGQGAQFPPVIVEIAWPAIQKIYFLFGALLLVGLIGLIPIVQQVRIFQVIKLGETQ